MDIELRETATKLTDALGQYWNRRASQEEKRKLGVLTESNVEKEQWEKMEEALEEIATSTSQDLQRKKPPKPKKPNQKPKTHHNKEESQPPLQETRQHHHNSNKPKPENTYKTPPRPTGKGSKLHTNRTPRLPIQDLTCFFRV